MNSRTIPKLLSFLKNWTPFSSATDRENIVHRFIEAYTQPFRRYHTDDHILACLNEMEKVRGLIHNNNCFEAAIWYHDIFYIPGSKINEQASADIVRLDCRILGLLSSISEYVCYLITCQKPTKKVYDTLLFHDIDYSILGQDEAKYFSYARAIFWEYQYCKNFREGRRSFLKNLLKCRHIYCTDFFRNLYEQKARDNIKAELAGERHA